MRRILKSGAIFRLILLAASLMLVISGSSARADDENDAADAYNSGDFTTAVKLARPHANQGEAWAQHILGNCYVTGQGVELDFTEGAKWHKLAADQGDLMSAYHLGGMLGYGMGVQTDSVEAYKWLTIVIDRFDDTHKAWRDKAEDRRADIASGMTPDQIEKAKGLAKAWKPE